jgi:hypothetical protein
MYEPARDGQLGSMSTDAVERQRRSLAALVVVSAAAAVFALLLILVRAQWAPLESVDHGAAASINSLIAGNATLVAVVKAVSWLGSNGVLWTVIGAAAIILVLRKQWRLAIYLIITRAGALTLDPILKSLVGRLILGIIVGAGEEAIAKRGQGPAATLASTPPRRRRRQDRLLPGRPPVTAPIHRRRRPGGGTGRETIPAKRGDARRQRGGPQPGSGLNSDLEGKSNVMAALVPRGPDSTRSWSATCRTTHRPWPGRARHGSVDVCPEAPGGSAAAPSGCSSGPRDATGPVSSTWQCSAPATAHIRSRPAPAPWQMALAASS